VTTVVMALLLPIQAFPYEMLWTSQPLLGRFAHLALPGWALLAWVVVFGTVVPYVLVANGLRLLRASTASLLGMTEPVMAGLIAWWWLGEALTPVQLAGSVVVLAGVMAADRVRAAVASD
jgi:drug/metabolite transporter (DMT)-like permease